MLDEVPAKEFETLEVPTEEYCGILLSLLKGLDGPSSDRLQLLLCRLKLVVLLQFQLTLDPKVGTQSLDFLLQCGSLVHRLYEVLFQRRVLLLQSLHPGR